ncbi:MAG: Lrp/AsnC family transcriptional regulator [Candidatus Bathyarchaeota archaeon]|nr:Lrp/AsnC family transcriptional regulator [Candidatus Bathyarchaeota archaeon]
MIVLFWTERGTSVNSVNIDGIDLKIIRALQKDARTVFADIARDCGVSTDTISKRFRKMKKTGIIRGTTILLNPKSFGFECVGSLGVDVSYPHLMNVVESIQKIPEIVSCTRSMGKHDIFCIAVLKNVGRLSQVKELIKGHPAVREVTTSIWVDEILLCPENFEFKHLERE